ncbi:hypothetical protein ACFWIN_00405 [Streptomyces sp. NPDC127049]|uniref:hypothetical protein n=1 Tax=Streptomyces sp. NPDC127049 TaxID=3347118 RepID=UPI0036615252
MPGGETRDIDGAGLARTELNSAEGDRSDPAQAAHPLEIDPADTEPGGGLRRPERRLTGQQLGQALPDEILRRAAQYFAREMRA